MPDAGAPAVGELEKGETTMTTTILNAMRASAAKHDREARRARRQRIGSSQEFRNSVAEFDARRRAALETLEASDEDNVQPRHVIAAEAILARVRQGIDLDAGAVFDQPDHVSGKTRLNRVGPVYAFGTAKRIVLSGLDRVDHRLQRALRRHGFDRSEVAEVADAVMSGIPHRAELALNHLPMAPRPVDAAKHLFDTALDKIADNLGCALRRYGLGRDRIADIASIAIQGVDERVATALDGLADSWTRTRGAVGAT